MYARELEIAEEVPFPDKLPEGVKAFHDSTKAVGAGYESWVLARVENNGHRCHVADVSSGITDGPKVYDIILYDAYYRIDKNSLWNMLLTTTKPMQNS